MNDCNYYYNFKFFTNFNGIRVDQFSITTEASLKDPHHHHHHLKRENTRKEIAAFCSNDLFKIILPLNSSPVAYNVPPLKKKSSLCK